MTIFGALFASPVSVVLVFAGPDGEERSPDVGRAKPVPAGKPVTVEEARGRARLLYEVIRGALQVMHRDFFDPDDRTRIPSASLEDVFERVQGERGVVLGWLGVNAKTMNVDHEADDTFEKAAVAALAEGATEFEAVEGGSYRFVGAIRLHNVCLKCHVPHRKGLETRTAGLSVRVPVLEAPAPAVTPRRGAP